MSIETDATEAATDDQVEALASRLGDAIADIPEYRRFEEAQAAVQADDEAQERISEFERLRQEFAMARQAGRADQETMRKVQEAQRDLHSLPVMEEYVDAQDELQDRLETLNEAVSAPLEVDFGGEAGGCCQD
ncbi:YlbF family regulator [Halobaculum sp. CBA1158]|uniref:YlbF family regulator n=1 Tax=Halobaculum sp. CBA1158 TaxID=2904243 RepID=UPI001F3C962C|nr:YlbF family regulator [Halobaculum sp. CBA1158]UIO98859.1 YlbF family regulator [Halobaculum sp. CBA1158]